MEEEDSGAGIPEWVVTFGDMMSLLLTFFIMLVSMSEIKQEEQFQALVDSMRRRFGHMSASASMAPGDKKPRNSKIAKLATEGRAKRFNTMDGGDKVQAPVGDHPRVEIIRRSDDVSSGGVITFDEHSDKLNADQRSRLDAVVAAIKGKSQRIEIRGHTTRRPLPEGSAYHDHLDLAYARTRAVMDYLVSKGIDPDRIRLTSSGGNEPVSNEPDPLEQKKNRRVDIFLLDQSPDRLDLQPNKKPSSDDQATPTDATTKPTDGTNQ